MRHISAVRGDGRERPRFAQKETFSQPPCRLVFLSIETRLWKMSDLIDSREPPAKKRGPYKKRQAA
jgi:hypothetical protein